jgi:hypothetical protein
MVSNFAAAPGDHVHACAPDMPVGRQASGIDAQQTGCFGMFKRN